MRQFVLCLGLVVGFCSLHFPLYAQEKNSYKRYKSANDSSKEALRPPSFWRRPLIASAGFLIFGPAFFISSLRKYDAIYLTAVFILIAILIAVIMTIIIYRARRKKNLSQNANGDIDDAPGPPSISR